MQANYGDANGLGGLESNPDHLFFEPKDDPDERPLERWGTQLFQGRAKTSGASQESAPAGHALCSKDWWKRGALDLIFVLFISTHLATTRS